MEVGADGGGFEEGCDCGGGCCGRAIAAGGGRATVGAVLGFGSGVVFRELGFEGEREGEWGGGGEEEDGDEDMDGDVDVDGEDWIGDDNTAAMTF